MPEQSSAKPSFGLENFTTLPQLLVNSVERYGEREALRQFDKETKSWHSLSYAQLMVRVMEWRRAYAAMNLERGTRIGILMPNSIDHACADQAALANGLVPVPLHAIDTPGASAFILSDSRAKVLVTNKLTRWKQIKAAGGDLQDLTAVIITEDEVDDETGMYLLRTKADCPEIDGSVLTPADTPLETGAFYKVTITDSDTYDLYGYAEERLED